MPPERTELRPLTRRLLESGQVEVVLGYRRGQEPLAATPLFARDAAQTEALIFDRTCETNLANYLPRLKSKKVAIVVKGCDERSVIGLIQEKQVQRENLVILGAPCPGVLDRKRVLRAVAGHALTAGRVGEDSVTLAAGGAERTVPIAELLYPGCRDCPVHNPRFADHLLADPVPQSPRPEFDPEVETVEAETPDRRWERFRREMGRCILCFACRQLCPACYCTECFAESSQPKWMGRTDDPADAMFFHLTRLLHLAGRCTGCGACVRGCPMEVNLRLYNDKLRKDAKATFRFEAGMDPAAPPPLVCYHAEDPNEFVR